MIFYTTTQLNYAELTLLHYYLKKETVMTKNMGTADRVIRVMLAIAVILLYLAGTITGVAAVILGIIAAIFIITSLVGYCPLYVPLKISTRKHSS